MQSPIEFRKVWALTKRDIYNWSTYKSQILTTVATSVIGIAAWGINADYRNITSVPQYNTDYVSFLIVGILVTNLVLPLGSGVQKQLNPWTLETILMTGIKTPTFVLGTSLWTYILSVVLFIPQLYLGIYVFGAHLVVNYVSLVAAHTHFQPDHLLSGDDLDRDKDSDEGHGPDNLGPGHGRIPALGSDLPCLAAEQLHSRPLDCVLASASNVDISHNEALDPRGRFAPQPRNRRGVPCHSGLRRRPRPHLGVVYRWGLNRAKKDGTLGWY